MAVGGGSGDLLLLGLGKARGANDQIQAHLAADLQVGQGAFGAGEVDQAMPAVQTLMQIAGDAHAARPAQAGCCVLTQMGAACDVERAAQAQVVGI